MSSYRCQLSSWPSGFAELHFTKEAWNWGQGLLLFPQPTSLLGSALRVTAAGEGAAETGPLNKDARLRQGE